MSILKIVQTKCVKCGICVEVCPTRTLEMGENGPIILNEEQCIGCGHCVAICSTAALDNEKSPLANQVPNGEFPVVDAQTAARFLRSRRSVRCFKQEKVSRETLLKLLDITRFASTAVNSQGLSFITIDSPEVLRRITAVTIDWIEEQFQAGLRWAERYGRLIKDYRETGEDVILRGAPLLLLATAQEGFPYGHDNTRFSLAYLELYATALGLGSCWIGFIERCATAKYPPLIELLKLPLGKEVTGVVVVGYPKYSFKRLVDRNPLQIVCI